MDTIGNVVDMDTRTMISAPMSLQRGSNFNVIFFLSNHTRKCQGLVRNSSLKEDSDIVNFDILKGKVVMICCFTLPVKSSTTDSAVARAVSLVSSELHVFGAFELVIVVNMRHGSHDKDKVASFNDLMSGFPSFCLAVPYSDCDGICESLNFVSGSEPTGVLVNRNQRVEWHKSLNFFLEYGADAYPFTPERLAVITEDEEKDKTWKTQPYVSYFLSSNLLPYPKPSSLIRKNPGGGPGKENITCFETNSCVGLYLCYTGDLIPTLAEVHKSCCDLGLEFEIILVYMPFNDFDDPQLFQHRINCALEERKISWWVLPFVYWVSRKLWRLCRICHKDTEDRLIIIDQKNNFVEPHGEAVICHFGIGAYPFSRECQLERELERLRAVTLESLLVYRPRDYVLGMDSCYRQIPVESLQGKNVLLYLSSEEYHSDKFYDQLITYYHQIKAQDNNFEVVFVGLNTKYFPDFGSLCAMPWLVCPFDSEHSDLVSKKIFGEGGKCSTLVAFGKDGRICSIRAQRYLCSSRPNSSFNDNLRNEMITDLFGNHKLECCL